MHLEAGLNRRVDGNEASVVDQDLYSLRPISFMGVALAIAFLPV